MVIIKAKFDSFGHGFQYIPKKILNGKLNLSKYSIKREITKKSAIIRCADIYFLNILYLGD